MFEKIMRAELSFPTFMTQVNGCTFLSLDTVSLPLFSSTFIRLALSICQPACLPACTLTSSHSHHPPPLSRHSISLHHILLHSDQSIPFFLPVHSQNARSLLSQLLQRDPKERLGSGDGDAWEVKEHIFFWYVTFCLIVFIHSPSISSFIYMKELLIISIPYIVNLIQFHPLSHLILFLTLWHNRDIDFDSLASGRIIPPWTPCVAGSIDTSQFDLEFTSMQPIGQCCAVLYCTVLYCTVLYCTVLYCTVLYCTVLYCTVLFRTVRCCVFVSMISVCVILFIVPRVLPLHRSSSTLLFSVLDLTVPNFPSHLTLILLLLFRFFFATSSLPCSVP